MCGRHLSSAIRIGSVKFNPNGTQAPKENSLSVAANPATGVPPGEYVVTFDFPVLKSGGIEEEIDLFKGKYSSPTTSKWKVEVRTNSQEQFQLD